MKNRSWDGVLLAERMVQPGQLVTLKSDPCAFAFYPVQAIMPEGARIDYSAFTCTYLAVGQTNQWRIHDGKAERRAVDVLTAVRRKSDLPNPMFLSGDPMMAVALDAVLAGLWITMVVRNDGDRALPFAIQFVGPVVL